MKLKEIIKTLENIAPPEYAAQGDSIGLQVGNPDQDIRRIAVTLDATPIVVDEILKQKFDLVVSHHPIISTKYAPLSSIRMDIYPQSILYRLVHANAALFVMHTNFDSAEGGINDVLAERLGVIDTKILEPTYTEKMFKLIVFVPEEAVDIVRDKLAEAGAGSIGNYTHYTFQSPGTGTFKPLPGADPYIGKIGEIERTPEFRLETIVSQENLHGAISAMIDAHPYEEVAYDVLPLWNKGKEFGLGKYGRLKSPMFFDEFSEHVCKVLHVPDARIAGDFNARVETVALLGGGGGSRVDLAIKKNVDVYVTGDVGHHQMLTALASGMNIIDATHFWTERPGMLELAPRLQEILSPNGIVVEYIDEITMVE